MKNRYSKWLLVSVLSLLITIGFFGSGCKTVTTAGAGGTNAVSQTTLDPQATSDAIRVVVAAAVPFAIQKDTNCIPYLRAASIVLRAAGNAGNYDPAALQSSLAHISVKELKTPEAEAGINAAFAIYKAYVGRAVDAKLDQNQWVKPILLALSDGIEAGLPPM